MGCGASSSNTAASAAVSGGPLPKRGERPVKPKYRNLGPSNTLLGGDVKETAMFEGTPEAQLYQYVHGKRWHFYNDGHAVDMLVEYVFGPASAIEPLGVTVMDVLPDGIRCRLTVHPGETEPFIEGEIDGYSCSLATKAVGGEYLMAKRRENKKVVDEAVAAVRAVAGSTKDPEEVLFKCIEKGVPFVDLWFLPDDGANFRDGIDAPIQPTMWQRPSEYLPAELVPYVRTFNTVEPCDIDQGALGDCYYLSALACIAESPSLVEDIFAHPKGDERAQLENRVGAYRATLNKGGWWETYLLDNYFPTMSNVPYYAKNREDAAELWVQLLEKAQAKAHGSYSAIAGGDPLQALQDLTGFPTTRVDHLLASRDEGLFSRILEWVRASYMISLSTPSADEESDHARFEAAGLPMGHAYAVLDAVQEGGHSLVQIRNPWGNEVEWTGKWGDADPLWQQNPRVAAACKHQATPCADGTFWMAWADVLQYFTTGGACFTKRSWHDYRVRAMASGGVPNLSIEVNVTKRVEAFISLHQKDRRGEEKSSPDANYSSFTLAVSRAEEGRQRVHLHSTMDCEAPSAVPTFVEGRDIAMRYVFEPQFSPYVITPRIAEKDKDKAFVVGLLLDSMVGSGGIEVSFIDLTPQCPIFANYLSFDLADSLERQTAHYQHNPNVGAPIAKSGDVMTF